MIKISKTVYDPSELIDGKRVLVMSLWPRGISKQKVDVWMKDLGTPRETIKKWKNGEITWAEFTREYRQSLRGKESLLSELSRESRGGTITLLCIEKDSARCHRSILKEAIESV